MAPRKTGLGKGLDGMFPVYVDKSQSKEKKSEKKSKSEKKVSTSGRQKTGNTSDEEAQVEVTAETISYEVETKGKEGNSKKTTDNISLENKVSSNTSGRKISDKTDTTEIDISETVSSEDTSPKDKAEDTAGNAVYVDINKVEPNKDQPRTFFDEDSLKELSDSIAQFGIITPLIVADKGDYYEIIAGERRWRAARMAGLKEVPVIVRDYNLQETLEISLIENIQREDLNAIEEAVAYNRLLEEFSLTQDEVSQRVSKSRSTITNSLRLLKLDKRVQEMVSDGRISGGHGRALLAISDPDRQYELAVHIFDEKLSVREVERLIKTINTKKPERKKPEQNTALDIIYREMEDRIKSALGTKVSLTRKNEKRGKIEIEYYSSEELERIYELLIR